MLHFFWDTLYMMPQSCPTRSPDDAQNMPHTCPRWCPRPAPDIPRWCPIHAPGDAPAMPQMMPQTCPNCPRHAPDDAPEKVWGILDAKMDNFIKSLQKLKVIKNLYCRFSLTWIVKKMHKCQCVPKSSLHYSDLVSQVCEFQRLQKLYNLDFGRTSVWKSSSSTFVLTLTRIFYVATEHTVSV